MQINEVGGELGVHDGALIGAAEGGSDGSPVDGRSHIGRDPLGGGAPHIPPQSKSGSEVGGGGATRRGRASAAFAVGRDGVFEGEAPPRVYANKGTSKYPFGDMAVGEACRVYGRDLSTVRSALKRWTSLEKARRAWRWQLWRTVDDEGKRCVRVKRVK